MSNKIKLQRKPVERGIEAVSDGGIRFLIDQAFRWRVPADRIQVMEQNGVVKLWGSVPSFEDQQNAERAAGAVPGVFRVENYLKIEH